ncbi:cryptochrome/photolyase family protein [Streptomyces marispadix]|uniref:DNA photolyase family protein n=1 Tax=Streptomyces marispadix TaxID=2922868 RepID=A0ABS9SYZ0_9ACTN|nr:deoxyribodipyrimidine photo-lyase [Streptomyces marispadix]MCH6161408.1 DNA photolyase family protein [Streptomyces marispadix]
MSVSVALFTSDLRVRDNPVLRAALDCAYEVVPLFVLDTGISAAGFDVPNRRAFLMDCLNGLDRELRRRGGRLVLRTGDVAAVACETAAECGARQVHVAGGVSGYSQRREVRLRRLLEADGRELYVHDAVVTAQPPGRLTPQSRDHFAVFTPYFRRWSAERLRPVLGTPRSVRVPGNVRSEPVPSRADVKGVSPGVAAGGESEGRARFDAWRKKSMGEYAERADDLAGDATSRLSPHLHFGTLSAVELVHRARKTGGEGAEAFVRQLAWRDFHHQVLAARPRASWEDYRPRGDSWRHDEREITAWRDGRTGYPLVDAAMRQLLHEGWMHNRARLLTASFLTKTLYTDWRVGARHFLDLLVDGDIVNNQLNWQWVAGTGNDTRPNRVLNPLTQARRFDPRGEYVRRWLPELAAVEGPAVHRPWTLPERERARLDYPPPLVDLSQGADRFLRARGR